MFRWAHIEHLWWLLALIPMIFLWVKELWWIKDRINLISSSKYRNLVLPQFSIRAKTMNFIWFALGWVFLIIAIANPQIGTKLYESKHEGIDLFLAIDVSNSMLAEDIRPNRLERTRMGVDKLVDNLQGDRLGIVVFAGQAFVQLPLTTDYAAAKLFTNTLNTTTVNEQGTSIGAAIETAISSFEPNSETSKVIIIVTDGEDHEEDAIKMAKEAKEQGILIYSIGMGSVKGAPIPIYKNGYQLGYRKDNEGNTIVTKLNEEMLSQLAEVGGGKFFRANNGNIGLKNILDEINSLEKTELESKIFSDYEDRFPIFLLASLVCFLISILWPEKRLLLQDKFQIFKVK